MLPGMFNPAAPGEPFYIGVATNTNTGSGQINETLSISGLAIGDLLVLMIYADQGYRTPTWTGSSPSWTPFVGNDTDSISRYIAYATANENGQVSLETSNLVGGDFQDRVIAVSAYRNIGGFVDGDTEYTSGSASVSGTGILAVVTSAIDDKTEAPTGVTSGFTSIAELQAGFPSNSISGAMGYKLDAGQFSNPSARFTWASGSEPISNTVLLFRGV